MQHPHHISPHTLLRCRPLIESLFAALQACSGWEFALLAGGAVQLGTPQWAGVPSWSCDVDGHGLELGILGSGPQLAAVGQSAVAAIQQFFRQDEQQQVHTSMLGSLYEISTSLVETIQLNDLLERILQSARQLVKASSGSLVMLDQVHSELKMLQTQDEEVAILTTTKVSPGEDLQSWLREEGQLRRVPGGAIAPPVLSIPLKSQNRIVGSLTLVGHPQQSDFAERDVQALSILAGHAANAIHNAQLFGQVERQVSELQALHQLSLSLNRTASMQEGLEQLLDQTLSLLDAENASVMLLEEDGETLRIHSARGLPEEVVRRTRLRLGERIAGKVAQERQPMLVPAFEGEETGSALSVPMLKDGEVVGVLNVRNKTGGGDFTEDELSLAARFANVAALSVAKAGLHLELRQLFAHSILALANAIDARDPYTSGHSERVTTYAVAIAERLGFSDDALEELRYASLLHDIGKIRIRDHILHKPGKLTDEEFEEMKRHPEYGVEIMRPVRAFEAIFPSMLHHHERFDGRGYPAGLQGEQIPLQARIMCVADCFDAMTSDRPYRRGMPWEEAVAELVRHRGSQFDPEAVDLFVTLVREGKLVAVVEA